jgi:hypothetical protein
MTTVEHHFSQRSSWLRAAVPGALAMVATALAGKAFDILL